MKTTWLLLATAAASRWPPRVRLLQQERPRRDPRYFTPETLAARPDPSGVAQGMRPVELDLRLGRVNAASYVKDRIAFREKSFEVGYYDELRWTEKPEAYLRRALGRALFDEQGVRQILSGVGPTLDVELDAFEEVRAPRHAARMEVSWALSDDARVQSRETFVVERPMPADGSGGPDAIAAAMAQAFDASVARVVAGVVTALAREAAPKAPPVAAGRP